METFTFLRKKIKALQPFLDIIAFEHEQIARGSDLEMNAQSNFCFFFL